MFYKLNFRKIIKVLLPVYIVLSIISCSTDPEESLEKLKKTLPGEWESYNNVKINFFWEAKGDGLQGFSFNVINNDTLTLNKFTIDKSNDTLFLMLSGPLENSDINKYFLSSNFWNIYRFQSQKKIYPFYITFDLKKESIEYTQSNNRKNKEIKFLLKRKR